MGGPRTLLRSLAPSGRLGSSVPLATALRRSIDQGYDLPTLRADVLAGLVVGVVALPLSMALAIAVGVPPQHGLYTAIVAGALVALTGGSKFQVTGPTAAFVVILAPITTRPVTSCGLGPDACGALAGHAHRNTLPPGQEGPIA